MCVARDNRPRRRSRPRFAGLSEGDDEDEKENEDEGRFQRTRPYRAEISSIRSIGRRARFKISAGNSMRGASFFMQSRSFSSVFNFMYLHSLQRQLSDGIRITSNTGAQRNSLPGHSFCIRWMMPDSVTMTNRLAGLDLHQVIIFSVEQTASARSRTSRKLSG